MTKKRYVLRKYVEAKSVQEALELDAEAPVDEIYLADEKPSEHTHAVGFQFVGEDYESEAVCVR